MSNDARKKSSRHSKIAGDFGEALVLYWLSKHGYECARVDHTGIDLIARHPNGQEVMGVSVKCRDRFENQGAICINLPADGFDKARRACTNFNCVPYYALVVDAGGAIRCFVLSMDHLETIAGGKKGGLRWWKMDVKSLERYRSDPAIQRFELQAAACSWREGTTLHAPT